MLKVMIRRKKWLTLFICWNALFSAESFAKTAPAPSFFALSANDISGHKVHFSQYRGKVVLVVNTASKGGFTTQLKDLEALYQKYSDKGFVVLAFPSNDFRQETQDNSEVARFVRKNYGVTFPLFDKAPVRGNDKQPVYQFLTEQKPGILFREVTWNFEKFLVNRRGQVVERWNSITSPNSTTITTKLEKALTDPI